MCVYVRVYVQPLCECVYMGNLAQSFSVRLILIFFQFSFCSFYFVIFISGHHECSGGLFSCIYVYDYRYINIYIYIHIYIYIYMYAYICV